MDANGTLSKPKGANFSAIEFKYAKDGSLDKRIRYDENMKEINI